MAVLLEFDAGIGHDGDRVQHGEIPGGVALEEFLQGFVAVFEDCLEKLGASDQVAGAMNEHGVGIRRFLQEVGGEFHLGFSAGDGALVFEIILVTALGPIGNVLGVEAFPCLAEFIDDDAIRQAIIEHAVEHVASFFGQARDFAVPAGIHRLGFVIGDLFEDYGGEGGLHGLREFVLNFSLCLLEGG